MSLMELMNSFIIHYVNDVTVTDKGGIYFCELTAGPPVEARTNCEWACEFPSKKDADEFVNHVRHFSPNVKVSNEIDITSETVERWKFLRWMRENGRMLEEITIAWRL